MGLSPYATDMSAGILDGPNGYEPQRQNNGLLYVVIPGLDSTPLQLAIRSFNLPMEQNGVVQVGHLNEKRKFAGNVEYQNINCQVYDYIDLDTAGFIAAWRKRVYNPANGKIGWKRSYAGAGYINLFGPNGQYTRTYNLIGVWPSQYDPGGQVEQESDQIMLVTMQLEIDKAIPGAATTTTNFGTN